MLTIKCPNCHIIRTGLMETDYIKKYGFCLSCDTEYTNGQPIESEENEND